MLKKRTFIIFMALLLVFPAIPLTTNSQPDPHNTPSTAQPQLVIYTYASLLNYPNFDYVQAYADYSGIPRSDIQVVASEDANTIVTRAALEKDDPVADVLIGVDNILIHTAIMKFGLIRHNWYLCRQGLGMPMVWFPIR